MQHYTVYLFLENCSTCFDWYLRLSSGAHTTVFTVSGTCQTVTATCRFCAKVGNAEQFHLFHNKVEVISEVGGGRLLRNAGKFLLDYEALQYIERHSLHLTFRGPRFVSILLINFQ